MKTNKNIIKASAGTGKTYSLSLEYIYYLLKGIDFRNILVMTFTKKATFEIQERIFEFIYTIIKDKAGKDDLVNNIAKNFSYNINCKDIEKLENIYKDMLINKTNIRIDTIDGFIQKVFSQCIAEPILDIYDFEIIQEASEKENEFYEELILALINDKNFKMEFSKTSIEEVKKKLKLYKNSKSKILSVSNNLVSKYTKEDIINELKELLLEKYNDMKLLSNANKIKEVLISDKTIDVKYKTILKEIKALKGVNNLLGKRGSKNLSENEILSINLSLAKILVMIYETESFKISDEYINNAKIYYDIEYKIKKRRKILEFNDLTYYTFKHIYDKKLNLIENNKITDTFIDLMGGKFEVIMVDEFQDTSIDQFKLIKLLIDNASYSTCVGDEKQSIYEWRGGYKRLFENLENSLIDSQVKFLDTCYRSEREIINFVNDTFDSLENYKYNIVNSSKIENKGYVETIKVDKKEAFEIMVEKIKENGNYANSSILLRDNKSLEKIANLLEKEKIPYSLVSKSNLLDMEVIKKAHCLVEYLITKNPLKKYEFLRMNPSDVSLRKMQDILNGSKEIDYLKEFEDNYNNHNNYNSNIFDFPSLYIKNFTYGYKVNDILNLNEYFKIMKTYPSLVDFFEYISKNKKEKKSIIENDAIILQTIHSSKGLEYDNVYIFENIELKKEKVPKEYVKYDEENNYNVLDFRYVTLNILEHLYEMLDELDTMQKEYIISKLAKESDFNIVYENLNKTIIDGNRNTYYVAYTRAKKNLFIFFTEAKGNIIKRELKIGEFIKKEDKIEVESQNYESEKIEKYFNLTNYTKSVYEKFDTDRLMKQKKGSALHYFLEVYDGDFELAKKIVLKKYSNLFSSLEMQEIINISKKNILKLDKLLKNGYKRFSEFNIYYEDKLNIIDLLLVDFENKKAYIYDYKSGVNIENNLKYKEQLERYKEALLKIFKDDYEIKMELLEIERE